MKGGARDEGKKGMYLVQVARQGAQEKRAVFVLVAIDVEVLWREYEKNNIK
jgi:hypothetical protein